MDDLEYTRFLISDVDQDRQIFTDEEIDAVIDREGGVKIAAALLMERIADNEVLIAKKITSADVTTDGPAVAAALRASAAGLRAEWAAEQEALSGGPVIVEYEPGCSYSHGWL